jgi:outer membrane protein assembly factor BamB
MKKLSLLFGVVILSGCSLFGADEDDAAITPAELVDFTSEVSLEKIWSTSVGSGNKDYLITLRPVANGNTIFAADYSGAITALDARDGSKIWDVELDASVTGGVGFGFGMVMVGTIDGVVHALDSKDGSVIWTRQVSSEVLSSPKTNGKIVVVHSIDNQMVALSAQDGDELWRHNGDAPILSVRGTSESIITSNMVVSGFDSGKLISFNADNGSINWETRLALPKGKTELERMVDIDGEPILVGDVIYATSYQGRIGAVSRGTGRNLWSQDASSHSAPAHSDGQIYISGAEDSVEAYASGNGQLNWTNDQLFLRRLTGPAIFGGTIAVADSEGFLHLLDSSDGHFVGRTKVHRSGVSSPLLPVNDHLIIQANNGSLSAYKIQ